MADKNKQINPPERSTIEKLPEGFRRKIFWLILVVLVLIVFFSWLTILPATLAPSTANKEEENSWQNIISDLSLMFEKSKAGLQEINQTLQNLKNASANSTSTDLTAENILKLKEKIIEKETANWLTFQNQPYDYRFKYPDTWTLNTSTPKNDSAGLIVNFSSGVNIQNPYQAPDISGWSTSTEETVGPVKKQVFRPSNNASSTAGLVIAFWNQDKPDKSGLITFQYSDENDPNIKNLDLIISTIKLSSK